MKLKKVFAVAIILALVLMTITACGTPATVAINDRGAVTEVEVKLPRTVGKILEAAEITLGEEDEVSPSADTKISEPEEIMVLRKNTVNFSIGGQNKSVVVKGGTVADLLKQEGITLTDKQTTSVALDEYLTDGMELKVLDLITVKVKVDGETKTINASAGSIKDALAEAGITVGADDIVTPEVGTAIEEGMEVTIDRVTTETVTEKEVIEYEVEYQYDSSLSKGYEETTQEGVNGEKEVTYKIKYVNGEEESREALEEKVLTEPVNAIVVVGTYEAPAASSSSNSSGGVYETSRKAFYDCDGSGHGYYEIHYSDGSVKYVEF